MSDKRQQPSYPLRMPLELREQIESSSSSNKRSVNAEIVARLEDSFLPKAGAPLTIFGAAELLMDLCKAEGVKVQIILGEVDDDSEEDDD